MNIIILSASNPFKTAGIVAYDLYTALKKNHNTKILVKDWKKYSDKNIITIDNKYSHALRFLNTKFKRGIRKLFKRINKNYKSKDEKITESLQYDYYFEYNNKKTFFSTKHILRRIPFLPDVIIVMFMPGFINYKNLFELQYKTKSKIILMPMDMVPFTGGCHYAWDCKQYISICKNCPALINFKNTSLAHEIFSFKQQYLDKIDLIIIAGSEYILQQIKQSSLFKKFKKYKVLLPINPNLFKPVDKKIARNFFNFPDDKKVLFIGAIGIKDKRKGFQYLVEALQYLYQNIDEDLRQKIHIAIAANYNENIAGEFRFSQTYLGYLNFEELSLLFQASDIFLNASIEDSGPMMINQAIMSGTPVVAFNMGIAQDLVITNKTGYLAILKDFQDFARGIKNIISLNDKDYNLIRMNCRELAISNFHPDVVATKIIEIIKN